jgi:hypothetical protein
MEKTVVYYQFDNNEPKECMRCDGNEFTFTLKAGEDGWLQFTDREKTFKLLAELIDE